jgi:hypothetical protein
LALVNICFVSTVSSQYMSWGIYPKKHLILMLLIEGERLETIGGNGVGYGLFLVVANKLLYVRVIIYGFGFVLCPHSNSLI